MTECHIWPPEQVFEVPLKELKIIGASIAKKKGEEQEFLAKIHGAKLETRGTNLANLPDIDAQIEKGRKLGMNIEVTKGGKPVK